MGGGYRANVTRGHALALVVVAGAAIQAAGAGAGIGGVPAGAVSGRWVGGFQLGSVPTGLHVTLSQRHGHLRGTAEIGLAAPPVEEPLRRVSVHRARVTLILPDGTLLEGRRRGSLIAGIARAGNSRGRFELRSIRPVALRELRHAVGAYRLANGSVISLFVEPFGSHLRIVDYQSGEMRQLWPVSRDAFLGGPRLLVPWPIRFRVELVRDARRKVVGLRRNGQNADRIPLVIESAAFRNGDVRLVGKLVLPRGPGPFRAVVLVPGSERATRDTLDLWGMFFASRGFAVLSHDKRGVGQSTGRYAARPSEANLHNLARDALAGMHWLRTREDIDAKRIGLTGGSQAGWTIVVAAAQSRRVAFAAIQSGAAMSVRRQRAYSALTGSGSVVPPPSDTGIRAALDGSPDGGFDPRPALSSVRIPLLWQLGAVDKRQYTPESVRNLRAIAAQGGHDLTVRIYPRGAHSLRETRQGLISEELRASRFVAGLFPDLAGWLATHVR